MPEELRKIADDKAKYQGKQANKKCRLCAVP